MNKFLKQNYIQWFYLCLKLIYDMRIFCFSDIHDIFSQALLSGCSAGGLATLIHCDDFRKLLPKDATVKCLADAGFFLDEYVLLLSVPSAPILLAQWFVLFKKLYSTSWPSFRISLSCKFASSYTISGILRQLPEFSFML